MAFASTFQLQQTTLLDSLHSSLSRQVSHLCRFHSSSSFKHKDWSSYSSIRSSTFIRKPNSQPRSTRSPLRKHARIPSEVGSTHASTWIRSWGDDSRFRLLPKRPRAAVDYRSGLSSDDDEFGTSASTGSSTMGKIIEKLRKFGYMDDSVERKERPLPEKGSIEDIFYAEDGVLPNARGGLSLDLRDEVRFPWGMRLGSREYDAKDGSSAQKKKSTTMLAELMLPKGELTRLRHLGIRSKSKIKIGGAGVTKDIVDAILETWKTTEVVRIKCECAPALNMKRMHEILERKTGGLVIWRSGTSVLLYRGESYEVPKPLIKPYHSVQTTHDRSVNVATYKHNGIETDHANRIDLHEDSVNSFNLRDSTVKSNALQEAITSSTSLEIKTGTKLPRDIKYEDEIDKLLDSVGPRYTDWPGSDPLPVDADLLPGNIPGYEPPFRILPYGVRASLGCSEATALKRLARKLPPHFVLGRNRQHHGLAVAMAKLWEKSIIAKIALKRGVQLTTSERIAAEIKNLTGGTILSRNKDYIVFYRGKDFLSKEVSEALVERERLAKVLQDEEEQARIRASAVLSKIEKVECIVDQGTAGTLGETLDSDARWGKQMDNGYEEKMFKAVEAARHANIVRKLEKQLSLATRRVLRAEKALAKVEESLIPSQRQADPESITEEERFMFRKLGLRMKAFLLLGRRGVFDGTIENMHLHWKYRELVKVIVKVRTFTQAKNIAMSLEAESGGVLVSVDKVSKGYAVIVFRGKDYSRPSTIRPRNLLSKRKALARSIELQRREALNRNASVLRKRIEKLRFELNQMEGIKEQGDEELYTKLDLEYNSEDEETEDESEDEDAYLRSFDNPSNVDIEEEEDHDDDDDDEMLDHDASQSDDVKVEDYDINGVDDNDEEEDDDDDDDDIDDDESEFDRFDDITETHKPSPSFI